MEEKNGAIDNRGGMMDKNKRIRNSTTEFLIFAAQNEMDSIEVRFENETLWLTQKWMAMLFGCSAD